VRRRAKNDQPANDPGGSHTPLSFDDRELSYSVPSPSAFQYARAITLGGWTGIVEQVIHVPHQDWAKPDWPKHGEPDTKIVLTEVHQDSERVFTGVIMSRVSCCEGAASRRARGSALCGALRICCGCVPDTARRYSSL
jgi:hypothetical protein